MNRLPAEWSKQSGVMMTWPHADSYWQPVLAESEIVFAKIIAHIAEDEKVLLSCHDVDYVRGYLNEAKANIANVLFFPVASNDVWTRDYGPITVLTNQQPLLLKFKFNAWGAKYAMPLDNEVVHRLHEQKAYGNNPLRAVDLILEGGSIESDGAGTLLTTRRCLLKGKRNQQSNEKELAAQLTELFGLRKILWLNHGLLAGDDTDAHIDTLVRFCNENTICYQSCDDVDDEHYPELQKMAEELHTFSNADGKPYHLVPLPWPQIKNSILTGDRLPAGYANFLITNSKVIVPIYNDVADEQALEVLQNCFPDRQVVGVMSLPLIENFGSIHCVTMQLPVGVLVDNS